MKNTHKGSSQDVGKSPVFGRQALGEKMDRSHFRKSDSNVALAALKDTLLSGRWNPEEKTIREEGAGRDLITPLSLPVPSGLCITRMEKRYFEAKKKKNVTLEQKPSLFQRNQGGQHRNSTVDIRWDVRQDSLSQEHAQKSSGREQKEIQVMLPPAREPLSLPGPPPSSAPSGWWGAPSGHSENMALSQLAFTLFYNHL